LRCKVHASVRPAAFAEQDPARCAALIRAFVERGTWHTPTLHFVAFRALALHKDPEWLDAYRYLPAEVRERRLRMLDEFTDESRYTEWTEHGRWAVVIVGQMYRAGVRLLAGTDAPGFMPGFTIHDELEALGRAGLTPLAALQTATVNPARYFRMEDESGSIAPGKLADLVLLEADPLADIRNSRRIAMVIVAGRVFDRGALDRMLASLQPGEA
jgi:hypothetical protein